MASLTLVILINSQVLLEGLSTVAAVFLNQRQCIDLSNLPWFCP